MKKLVLIGVVLAVFASISNAQKLNLVGTTWIITYTTGRQNAKDYEEYARITFLESGKCRFDNGDMCRWKLKRTKLTAKYDGVYTASVNSIEATLKVNLGSGQAELGQNNHPYWIRMKKT